RKNPLTHCARKAFLASTDGRAHQTLNMRTPILPLLLVACVLAGCQTLKKKQKQPPPPPPPQTNTEPVVEPEIVGTVPDAKKGLSDADVEELKHRLDQLK